MQFKLLTVLATYLTVLGGSIPGTSASPMQVLSDGATAGGICYDSATNITPNPDSFIAPAQRCGDPRRAVPFLRMWNPTLTDHFYTTNEAEYENASKNGWNKEGVAGYCFTGPQPNTGPLYRLWSPKDTDHFYTLSSSERANAINNLGYKDEGVACYVYTNTADGQYCGRPLYRLWNPYIKDHFYTMSADERKSAIDHSNYKDEGIAAYLLPY